MGQGASKAWAGRLHISWFAKDFWFGTGPERRFDGRDTEVPGTFFTGPNEQSGYVDPVLCQAIDTMPASDWLRVRIVGKKKKDTEWLNICVLIRRSMPRHDCSYDSISAFGEQHLTWEQSLTRKYVTCWPDVQIMRTPTFIPTLLWKKSIGLRDWITVKWDHYVFGIYGQTQINSLV